jgi:hypothetical protein
MRDRIEIRITQEGKNPFGGIDSEDVPHGRVIGKGDPRTVNLIALQGEACEDRSMDIPSRCQNFANLIFSRHESCC